MSSDCFFPPSVCQKYKLIFLSKPQSVFWLFASQHSTLLPLLFSFPRDFWWAVKEHRWTPTVHLPRLREIVIMGTTSFFFFFFIPLQTSKGNLFIGITNRIQSLWPNEKSEFTHLSKTLSRENILTSCKTRISATKLQNKCWQTEDMLKLFMLLSLIFYIILWQRCGCVLVRFRYKQHLS